jgi:hypothetical protein
LDPPLSKPLRRKSHLLKAHEKVMAEIRKGKQASIARALRTGSAIIPLPK